MPIGSLEKGREKTTLVFDTWANVGDEAVEIHWDCELTDDEAETPAATRRMSRLSWPQRELGRGGIGRG